MNGTKPCGDSPKGMACIAGGEFRIGLDDDPHEDCDQHSPQKRRRSNTQGAHLVSLGTFHMDKTEVTNEAYRSCVKAGKCQGAGPNYRDFKRPRQPVTGVSFFHASAFCEAQGKHLPTEAEWEAAARGPKGELTPWGQSPVDCSKAVIRDPVAGRSCGVRKLGGGAAKGRVLKVGSRPAGRYGLFDMIGNAEEWTADWYSDDWGACGKECLGRNPRGPCQGKAPCPGHRYRSVRGGSWYWPTEHATGVHRRPHHPANRPFHHFGFRCAASVEEASRLTGAKPRGR